MTKNKVRKAISQETQYLFVMKDNRLLMGYVVGWDGNGSGCAVHGHDNVDIDYKDVKDIYRLGFKI